MKLSDKEIESKLANLNSWAVENNALAHTYTFATFPDAIAFVTRLAFAAEAADHHPDLHISYRRVRVVWSTHSAGGITEKDFEGVKQSEMIATKIGFKA
jgi:4a-hydroxytetrahydrobiopterin dehydratase